MLTENDIVEKVTDFLETKGYRITQSLTTNQQGIDIIAETESEKLFIEAKGETSSVKTSKRFGLPFNKNQIKSHISVALLASMKVISKIPADNKTKIGIALPDTTEQRQVINEIKPALRKLKILIYWVTDNKVTIE
jgi:CHAT domain-containing protein